MQIALHIYVDDNADTARLIANLTDAVNEDEGITIKTAGGSYFLDDLAMEVKY